MARAQSFAPAAKPKRTVIHPRVAHEHVAIERPTPPKPVWPSHFTLGEIAAYLAAANCCLHRSLVTHGTTSTIWTVGGQMVAKIEGEIKYGSTLVIYDSDGRLHELVQGPLLDSLLNHHLPDAYRRRRELMRVALLEYETALIQAKHGPNPYNPKSGWLKK